MFDFGLEYSKNVEFLRKKLTSQCAVFCKDNIRKYLVLTQNIWKIKSLTQNVQWVLYLICTQNIHKVSDLRLKYSKNFWISMQNIRKNSYFYPNTRKLSDFFTKPFKKHWICTLNILKVFDYGPKTEEYWIFMQHIRKVSYLNTKSS